MIQIYSKGLYAIEMLVALAKKPKNKAVLSVEEISHLTGVAWQYAEQLMLKMKKAGITESKRGNAGGYLLIRKPSDISLAKIFSAVGEEVAPWKEKASKKSRRPQICPLHPVWRRFYETNHRFLKKTKLSEFI